jgi:DNA-binding NtrC family response regulator
MTKPYILVVDDDLQVRKILKFMLEKAYEVGTAALGAEAIEVVKQRHIDIVLLDVGLPDINGIEVLEKIKDFDASIGVIMLSGLDSASLAVSAIKLGAYDYLTKPFANDDLLLKIKRYTETLSLKKEVSYLKEELQKNSLFLGEILSNSPKMKKVFELIENVSKAPSNVLITGESGTGKELVAKAIQAMSARKDKPFVTVNCGAVPAELMESELFGHEKGAFTGAHARKIGKFEYADGGTLFFDEVGTLPMSLQVKLLRVIQEMSFERVGGNIPIKVDVRIIAATNADLETAIKKGTFREDLYYRLKVVPIELPPLRERTEDIPLLVRHFITKHCGKCAKSVKGITAEAMNTLCGYAWPGNVRELENFIERLVVMAKSGAEVTYDDLPVGIFYSDTDTGNEPVDESKDFTQASKSFEKHYILGVLNKTKWNRGEAAKVLNMHRNTLLMKIKTLGIKPPFRSS